MKGSKMKILVLNGSPKRELSDTMHMTRAFLEGIKEDADTEIEIIHVIDRHIEFCRGCFACKRNGGNCVFTDDMPEILEKILGSDVLIFSFPLYCYGMPAALKNLVDRTMPLSAMTMKKVGDRYEHTAQADFSHLKYVMMCGCGFPNSAHNFEPMIMAFCQMFPQNHTIIAVPESPMFSAPEAVSVTAPRLELIKKAGTEHARTGTVSESLLSGIGSPMIPEEMYAGIVNGDGRS